MYPGQGLGAGDLMLVGWRTEALARIHAALAGRVPEGDTVPKRWMEPIPEGPLRGARAFLDERDKEEAIRKFYRLRGYHPVLGIPLPQTLRRLGLDWAVVDAGRALQEAARRLGAEPPGEALHEPA